MRYNSELRPRGLNYDFSDPCNLIHCIVSFLSRSTQESGPTKKEEKNANKSQKVKAIEEADKKQTGNQQETISESNQKTGKV